MKTAFLTVGLCILLSLPACSSNKASSAAAAAGGPLTTKNMEAVKGQNATCAGPAIKTFDLDLIETNVDLGMGTSFAAWTYNGRIPAPTLEACEGDKVTINVTNQGTTGHGL